MDDVVVLRLCRRGRVEQVVVPQISDDHRPLEIGERRIERVPRCPPRVILVASNRRSASHLSPRPFHLGGPARHRELRLGPDHFWANGLADGDAELREVGLDIAVDEQCDGGRQHEAQRSAR